MGDGAMDGGMLERITGFCSGGLRWMVMRVQMVMCFRWLMLIYGHVG